MEHEHVSLRIQCICCGSLVLGRMESHSGSSFVEEVGDGATILTTNTRAAEHGCGS